MSDIESTLSRIQRRVANPPSDAGVIVTDLDGHLIRVTPGNQNKALRYGQLVAALVASARSCVSDLDPLNELTFLRIRTHDDEILIAPDDRYILIVIQEINTSAE